MKIKIKRGLKKDLTLLDAGEFALCTDTEELYLGNGSSNMPIGETGSNGADGVDGKSIEFAWNGTSLGIKQEGQQEYKYVNLKGPKGDTGPVGPQGKIGLKGDQGIQGSKGDKGDTGQQGPKGDTGHIGPQGAQGIKGDKGEKGDQGIQGLRGLTGAQGSKGEQGLQGIQGAKGDVGERGPIGPQGVQGTKGDKGNTGPQGPKGADGLTTSIRLGPTQYNQANGIISLPAYPTIPTKLSQLQNDIGAGGGTNIVTSSTEPNLKPGEWWYKE
ncbi:hypothetical protein ACER0A_002255 [Haloimpatiens sp. FM7315]|uniref:hyaluronate lyase N-terminal domain-containing protein n=1 Tax=Haloimpatiens sp. FM7315 TaxID=3298609 RepID=UPI0035A3CF88